MVKGKQYLVDMTDKKDFVRVWKRMMCEDKYYKNKCNSFCMSCDYR